MARDGVRFISLVVIAVLGPAWPVGAEVPVHGHCRSVPPCGSQVFTAFNLEYFPKEQKTVGYGDVLQFLNADAVVLGGPGHSVTHRNPFGPPLFDSGVVPAGQMAKVAGVEHVTPGVYPFYCRVHPFMKSRLHVVGGGVDPVPIAP